MDIDVPLLFDEVCMNCFALSGTTCQKILNVSMIIGDAQTLCYDLFMIIVDCQSFT